MAALSQASILGSNSKIPPHRHRRALATPSPVTHWSAKPGAQLCPARPVGACDPLGHLPTPPPRLSCRLLFLLCFPCSDTHKCKTGWLCCHCRGPGLGTPFCPRSGTVLLGAGKSASLSHLHICILAACRSFRFLPELGVPMSSLIRLGPGAGGAMGSRCRHSSFLFPTFTLHT